MIGHVDIELSSLKQPRFRRGIGKIVDKAENALEKGVGAVADKAAEVINLHDFYSAHILNYCYVSLCFVG